jgi:hypothetical protein
VNGTICGRRVIWILAICTNGWWVIDDDYIFEVLFEVIERLTSSEKVDDFLK